ncbi:MAG: DUF4443 domain-containing protein [Asgard group archaeon]|nr:DUF4443 domain-containing protein [Asgard group archaeon]
MSKVHWIKTGQRGARAEFSDSDLITTLLLMSNEPIGRYQLQKNLLLSDSSSKSMLNFCKKIELLETAGKKGHQLTQRGSEFVNLIEKVILKHGICTFNFFPNMNHYFTIISSSKANNSNKEIQQVFASWKCRDIAIAYGADSIILLQYENGILNFPEEEMKLDDYYPDLMQYVIDEVALSTHSNYYLLFVAAKEVEIARKSAIITALHSQPNVINEIRQFFYLEK